VTVLFECFSIGFIGMAIIVDSINNDDSGCKKVDKLGNESDVCLPVIKPVCPNDTDSSIFRIDGEVYKVALYSIFFLIGTGSYAILNVAYNGLMADMTHPSIRGFGSGVMGTMIILGMLTGAGVGIFYKTIGIAGIFIIMYVVLVTTVAITVLTTKEQVVRVKVHAPVKWKSVLMSYWEPLKNYNFRWVFITRFLMQMGLSTVLGFLQYWMADMVHLPKCMCPETAVSMAMIPLLTGAAVSSAVGGYLSDRWQRRKPFVIGSALIMCIGISILAAVPNYYVAIVVALVFGICYGLYQCVDFALVMDVLPDHRDHAKDLAVWHQALVLPQLVATPIAGFILDGVQGAPLAGHPGKLGCSIGLGYIIIFLGTAVYFLLSSLFVLKLRKIR
jgi:MFS family permease